MEDTRQFFECEGCWAEYSLHTDIEDIKNDPAVQTKFHQALDVMYENISKIKFSLNDFF